MELETINKLYLELSQVATAKTAREIELEQMANDLTRVTDRAVALYGEEHVSGVQVMNLLKYIYDEKPEEFRKHYGTTGVEMLEKALRKPDADH